MNKLIVLSLLLGYAYGMARSRSTLSDDWLMWKQKHGKTYLAEEESKRQSIWEKNLKYVTQHNYEHDLGKHTYTLGMNVFADMTNEEYQEIVLSPMRRNSDSSCSAQSQSDVSIPDAVDWKAKGYVTPIKDQKQCGSCWAFSTTGSVEGQHFNATGKLVSLSEQNLMDCSGPQGNRGCNGGLMDYAFEYIMVNNGIDTEISYPYEEREGECRYNPNNVGATISSCVDVTSQSETQLQKAVAEVGPISVAIDASHLSFQLYHSGIYYEPECSSTQLDHGVLAVGYGKDSGSDFWMVKNSWGTNWGMEGYLMMSRNRDNNCGISTSASYPIV